MGSGSEGATSVVGGELAEAVPTGGGGRGESEEAVTTGGTRSVWAVSARGGGSEGKLPA